GYCFSKAATRSLSCGAQAHQVSVAGCCSAAASDDALAEPLGALDPEAAGLELELELEHAASASTRPAAAPAVAEAIRESGAFAIDAPFSIFFLCSFCNRTRIQINKRSGCGLPFIPSRFPRPGRTASSAA